MVVTFSYINLLMRDQRVTALAPCPLKNFSFYNVQSKDQFHRKPLPHQCCRVRIQVMKRQECVYNLFSCHLLTWKFLFSIIAIQINFSEVLYENLLIIILTEHFDFCFTCFLKMLLVLRKSLYKRIYKIQIVQLHHICI